LSFSGRTRPMRARCPTWWRSFSPLISSAFSLPPRPTPVTVTEARRPTAAAINFGSATAVTFTNGVSSSGGSTKLYKAENAAVAVTEGLLEQLPADQVKGVLAHEFAHIKNHDILISSIAAMVAGAISAIASILQFSMLFGGAEEEDSPLGLIGTLAAIIVAPIAAMLLQLAVSRQREYLADATGAQLLGRAAPLADALENLERGAQAIPMNINPAEASLYAINPLPRKGLATLFTTHPPIAERIRRLRALDGSRVVALAA